MNRDQEIGVVVGPLIVKDKGKILLFKSTKWTEWVFPGGHVDFGETLKEAVIRETKEETNLEIEPTELLNFGETIDLPTFYKKAHFIFFHFLVKLKSKELKLDPKELTEYAWFSPEEALRKANPVFKETIGKFLKKSPQV